MKTRIIIFLVLVSIITSRAHYHGNDKAHYKFGYGVYDPHTHDQKQHREVRYGNHVLGEYSLKEPDGSFRVVKYRAGPHTGFEAYVEDVAKPRRVKKKKSIDDIGVFHWDNDDIYQQIHKKATRIRQLYT